MSGMEKIIQNELIFREIMKNFSLDEIIELRKVCSGWKNAIKNYLACQQILIVRSQQSSIKFRDHLKMSMTTNMSMKMVLHNCISFETLLCLRSNERLKKIMSLFPNLEEFYLFRVCYPRDLIEILEVLQYSTPNIRKIMFEGVGISTNQSGVQFLTEQKLEKVGLENLLKSFRFLKNFSLHGSVDQSIDLFLFGSQDFDNFEHFTEFTKLSFICSCPYFLKYPLTLTEHHTVLDIFIVDYKIQNRSEDLRALISGLDELKNYACSVSIVKSFYYFKTPIRFYLFNRDVVKIVLRRELNFMNQ